MIIHSEMGDNAPKRAVIVQSATFVTLLGGGELREGDLEWALNRAPTLVAADGGADVALLHGREPAAVIGDLDSLSPSAREIIKSDNIHHIPEQLSTDFEKAWRSIEAPAILALGFTGGRLDHELATLCALLEPGRSPCFVIGAEDVIFHAPRRLDLSLNLGDRVSLVPLRAVQGRSKGLEWPIDGLDFAPGLRIGTSNRATRERVELQFSGPGMLVVLARGACDAAIKAVLEAEPLAAD
ncbi:MAG: thiamine diphosphokinase [Pseudomonadota bacterium]